MELSWDAISSTKKTDFGVPRKSKSIWPLKTPQNPTPDFRDRRVTGGLLQFFAHLIGESPERLHHLLQHLHLSPGDEMARLEPGPEGSKNAGKIYIGCSFFINTPSWLTSSRWWKYQEKILMVEDDFFMIAF